MNSHALDVLEFAQVLERVAARAQTEMGRELIRELKPETRANSVRQELDRVQETLRLLDSDTDWVPPVFPDATAPLSALALEAASLSSHDLHRLLELLRSGRGLACDLREPVLEQALVHLAELRARLPMLESLEEHLERVVDDDGKVRNDATPSLRALRARGRALRGRVVRELEEYVETLPDSYRVEGASVSVRDGRYVVAIRREGRSHVGGVIRGESATGATLFVEPPLALRLMNEMHELERDEAREVARILAEASDRLRPVRSELDDGFRAQIEFDGLWARARAAKEWEAELPEVHDDDDGPLRIEQGRHPLLLEKGLTTVPFELDLTEAERVVVVSGPNTGGKTVFLKVMGLIHLLAQSGVIPPVGRGTSLPVFRDVFADIGDEQSIAESLSTFSGHLLNAKTILEGAGPSTLVLMDELGSGTDPNEGAALARVIVERLVEVGARGVVTSHLGPLKRLDEEGSGVVNASLLFDAERMEPTFQLRKGRPGRSFGLVIARRLGLPDQLLDRAQRYVGSEELRLEGLLETLEQKERQLGSALDEARSAGAAAEQSRAEAEAHREELEERELTLETQARERARALLMDARREVEAAIAELNTSGPTPLGEAAKVARRRVERAARAHRDAAPRSRPRPERRQRTLRKGDRVRVVGSGASGVVRELRDERVTVEVGGVRLQVPHFDVEPLPAGSKDSRSEGSSSRGSLPTGPRSDAPAGGAGPAARPGWTDASVEVGHEVDLRGLRVDEVDLPLGRALDGAIVGDLSELRIIHGMGTGAVRARVEELLGEDDRIATFRPGTHVEGGAGVTVVILE